MDHASALEICVDTLEAAREAARLGADRIELCAALALGGLTPPPGMMQQAGRIEGAEIHCMIRPRSGDFHFSGDDHASALADIDAARQAGAAGVVIGASEAGGALDLAQMDALCARAAGMEITLHRAFDLVPEPMAALEAAVSLGVTRILTSGQAASADEGREMLAALVRAAQGRVQIMAGAGVNAENAARIWATGVDALHGSFAGPARGAAPLGFGINAALPDAGCVAAVRQAMDFERGAA